MAVELDKTRLAAQTARMTQADSPVAAASPANKLAALLGGASLMVTDGSMTDLEALVARIKDKQEKTKFSVLFSTLGSIGRSLSDAQKTQLEEAMDLTAKIDALEKEIDGMNSSIQAAKADAAVLQAEIDALQKQIDQAVQDGKDHVELVKKQKDLRQRLDAKRQFVADTQGKIAEASNQISSAKVKISSVVESVGADTLKTIAREFSAAVGVEKRDTVGEDAKKERKEEAVDVFRGIRKALDRFEGALKESIEERRPHLA